MTAADYSKRKGLRILLWSARYDLENGQAIVTRRVAERQTGITWIMAIYQPGAGVAVVRSALSAIRALFITVLCRPDAIYAVCARSTLGFLRDMPVLLACLLGFRVVVHVHGSDLIDLLQRVGVGPIARVLYRRCEIIVPSSHVVANLERLGCRRVTVCENFISKICAPATLPECESQKIKLLWNSNLMASKGIRETFEGAKIARERGANLTLTVLGRPIADEEATTREMAEFAKGLSTADWIDVVGTVSADRARQMVGEHDVILLPSRYSSECQPLAIIEAMAAAREVVIKDTPALLTTVRDYPAIVVSGDTASIAVALEALAQPASERSSKLLEGAKAARARFAPDRFDREINVILTESSDAPVRRFRDRLTVT